MVWTDERIDKLKKFWSEGLSASQIAVQLGGVTRNAVIGKVHRLFLASRTKIDESRHSTIDKKNPTIGESPSKIRRSTPVACVSNSVATDRVVSSGADSKRKSKFTEKEDGSSPGVVLPISRCLRLMELTEHTCKWPLGDPFGKDFAFCGGDVHNDSPYCDYHKRLAYQRVQDRRNKVRVNSK
ncbi:MAG: hypothetical protein EU981_01795 [Candidatus Liberibacter ctenarytainae]|uniref:GcrA cell cycle regulator n=1 Tax=Candidatus Liberibacter ctenarytainae TaxID=2020335 RepID=A0A937AC70_9HYPH|nr:hypothetical protein [Candidatus Liberibacter ctenarytainae]